MPLTYLLAYLLTCLLTYLLACLLTYLLTYLVTYLVTYLLTYLLTYYSQLAIDLSQLVSSVVIDEEDLVETEWEISDLLERMKSMNQSLHHFRHMLPESSVSIGPAFIAMFDKYIGTQASAHLRVEVKSETRGRLLEIYREWKEELNSQSDIPIYRRSSSVTSRSSIASRPSAASRSPSAVSRSPSVSSVSSRTTPVTPPPPRSPTKVTFPDIETKRVRSFTEIHEKPITNRVHKRAKTAGNQMEAGIPQLTIQESAVHMKLIMLVLALDPLVLEVIQCLKSTFNEYRATQVM